jgi:recombinational DNA repair protein (RecF pathway)
MAYSTYTTEAIVCGTRDRNTTDRSYLLFTREGGMLYAEARGVRREGSRQRYALQDFSRVRISLIRGKSGWRIGSVESLENYYTGAADRAARGSVVTFVKLLRRFARGEEPMVSVYDFTCGVLPALAHPAHNRAFLDVYCAVHFLALLGYVALEALPVSLRTFDLSVMAQPITPDYLARLTVARDSALAHSHL